MKSKLQCATGLVTLSLILPSAADIIYGSLQQIIPTDYTGVTINVGDGTFNPFFGGVDLANNNHLQPFRLAATGLSTIMGFDTGVFINAGSGALATGAGGSVDQLGTQFTAGTQGYVGFKLDAANYGWIRVVLTNNTSTPVTPMVMDWAYNNTGAAIKTGWINTDIVSGTAQTVTLNPASGESFTLSSALADASGSITNSVVKTGAGTTVLSTTSTYTGTTTISAGKLVVNGNISTSSLTTVNSGATLAGSGMLGAVSIQNLATLAPGPADGGIAALGLSSLTLDSGSYSVFEINNLGGSTSADLANVSGLLTFGGTLNVSYIGSGSLADGNVFNLFDWSTHSGTFSAINLPALDSGLEWDQTNLYVNGQIAVIPEPDVEALIGGLGLLALLRRRR